MNRSIGSAVLESTQILGAAGITNAHQEAGSLLAYVLGRDRTFVITHVDDPLPDEHLQTFRNFVARRASGEPLQYIIGHQEFFKLDFEVSPDVLIPRPETELIVETALGLLKDDPRSFIADIGTGSGCIAISLLRELPDGHAVATDISPAALRLAQRNAERHGVSQRLTLIEADCLSGLDPKKQLSLIASNPPYVSDDELRAVQREVQHEPRVALAAGADGLTFIRRLLRESQPFLSPGGHLVFEIGFGQGEAVEQLVDWRVWTLLEIRRDLQSIPRTFVLQRK